MSILKGEWKGTHNKYKYEFDFYGTSSMSTNAFSGYYSLNCDYEICGNQLRLRAKDGLPNIPGMVRRESVNGEVVFEFDISDKSIFYGEIMTLRRISRIEIDCISEFKLEKQPSKLINFISKCLFYGGMVFGGFIGVTTSDGSLVAAVIGAIIGGGIGYLIAWLVWYLLP